MSDNNNDQLQQAYLNSLVDPTGDPTQALINAAPLDTTPAPQPLPPAELQQVAPGLPMQQQADADLAQKQFDDQGNAANLAPQQPQLAPQQPTAPSLTAERTQLDQAFQHEPGYPEQQQAIQQQQDALLHQGLQEFAAYHNAAAAEIRARQTAEADIKHLGNEVDAATADVKKNLIKPDQYLENMQAGTKISTAIGLILGGMGGGMTGQENPVMKFLNAQIERDVRAQQENQGNRISLLGALERQLGNKIAAEQMFSAIRRNTLADQLGAAASQAKGPLAQAAAMKATSDLKKDALQNLLKTQQLIAISKNQQGGNTDPELLVPHIVPDNKVNEVLEGIGSAKMLKDTENRLFGPNGAYRRLQHDNTIGQRAMRLGYNAPSSSAVDALSMHAIKDSAGKYTEQEANTVRGFKPLPFDSADTVKQKERDFKAFLRQKHSFYNTKTKAYRIDLNNFDSTKLGQYSNAQIDAARRNPTDPRSQAILKSLTE